MFRKGATAEAQFNYWNLRRGGGSQSDISRMFDITRQSVSRSVKVQERDVVIRLLEHAQVSGILPTYYDQVLGILIGTIPTLGNLKCLLIIDEKNDTKMFYDPSANPDDELKEASQVEMGRILNSVLATDRFDGLDFLATIDELMKIKRGE
ncbi:MAG: MarR family transcriptional regulator [Candidatus Thermoplasmatota archaeon]|nr:MarR family transcriptional regulator [Candidatus Thermoplasmatota archaeon]